jgi:hypothetical protein
MTGSITYSGVAPGKPAAAAGVHLGSMVRVWGASGRAQTRKARRLPSFVAHSNPAPFASPLPVASRIAYHYHHRPQVQYVSQLDEHIPYLTVRETFSFIHR